MQYAYTDVTDRNDLVAPYPEVVAAFETLGWRALGRYAMEFPAKVVERLLAGYAEPARSEFAAHLPDVATVLLSPDGTTTTFVSWFWDQPAVRLASVLTDGTLVETSRLWTRKPPWPRALRSGWAGMDLREEMERSSVPARGRSIRTVAIGDVDETTAVATLADVHRAHVGEFAAVPVPFTSVEDAVTVRRKAFEHDLRVRNRAVRVLFGLTLVAAVVLGALSGLVPVVRQASGLLVVLEAAVLLLVLIRAQGWLVRRMTYVRWIRPPYRRGA